MNHLKSESYKKWMYKLWIIKNERIKKEIIKNNWSSSWTVSGYPQLTCSRASPPGLSARWGRSYWSGLHPPPPQLIRAMWLEYTPLKGQSNEIVGLNFIHKSNPPRPLTNMLKYFWFGVKTSPSSLNFKFEQADSSGFQTPESKKCDSTRSVISNTLGSQSRRALIPWRVNLFGIWYPKKSVFRT